MALDNIDGRTIKHALEDMDYKLIQYKFKVYAYLGHEIERRLILRQQLSAIHAPRIVMDCETRTIVKMMSSFGRLHRWAHSPATDDYQETVIVGEAEEIING